MLVIYTLYNFFVFLWGKSFFKKSINPITVYCGVWECAIVMHQSGLIFFYELSAFTWFVIFVGEFLFAAGCCIGVHQKVDCECVIYEKEVIKVWLNRFIVVCTLLSAIAILGNYFSLLSYYGGDLLKNITIIYVDRLSNQSQFESIPYLGSLVYVALAFAGIYTKKFGFTIWVIPVVALVYIKSLISGGRADLIFAMLILGFAFFLTNVQKNNNDKKKKKTKFNYVLMIIAVTVMVFAVALLTKGRAAGSVLTYATDKYTDFFGENIVPYKIIEYVAAPVGTLNEYLKECDFDFGVNTFKTIYNFLNKFGLMQEIDQYQKFYNTPISCNVATWLRELIQDFNVFSVFAVLIFGIFNGALYKMVFKKSLIRNISVLSVLFMVVALSFFDWRIRSADIWITILFCYLFGYFVDNKSRISVS